MEVQTFMPHFSESSLRKLRTCHSYLQELFGEVIKLWDCKVIEGKRSTARQADLLIDGSTTIEFSRHNVTPLSWAVDVAPYPVDWNDLKRFYHLAGIVLGLAASMGIPIRWGGNWKKSKMFLTEPEKPEIVCSQCKAPVVDEFTKRYLAHKGFVDLAHFELTGPDFKLKGTYI